MKKIVVVLPLFCWLMLMADVCPNGHFWVDKESDDPQVAMGVNNVIRSGHTDEQGNHVTDCSNEQQSLESVYSVSYTTNGNIKEVRKLTRNDGLNSDGTVCTPSGIYGFRAISPEPHSDPSGCTYSSCPTYCGYSFVFHEESCSEQGIAIAVDSADYAEATKTNGCYGTLEEAIELSKAAGYQDPGENEADASTDGDDITVTDNDSKSGGCTLTLL